MLQSYEAKAVHAPANATAAGVTGSYIDLQGPPHHLTAVVDRLGLAGAASEIGKQLDGTVRVAQERLRHPVRPRHRPNGPAGIVDVT